MPPVDCPEPPVRRVPSAGRDRTARTSLIIALVLHVIVALVFFVWAAKTGRLDNVLRRFDVVLAPKDKKPEPPKPEKKVEEPAKPIDTPKPQAAPPPVATAPPPLADLAPPPPAAVAPAVAPPPAIGADFTFDDGAKVVESATNAPIVYYKNLIEFTIRSNWQRPADLTDSNFLAEAEITLDSSGGIRNYSLVKTSGNNRWDGSVLKALAMTKSINRAPPHGFPDKFVVRFDVVQEMEAAIQ